MFVLKDAILNAIGIRAMTNREALMEELDAIPDDTFEDVLDAINIGTALQVALCDDCKAIHGGVCPLENDEKCPHRLKDWLSKPCRHERLLKFPEVNH